MERLLSIIRQHQPRLLLAAKVLLVAMFCIPLVVGNSYFFPFIVPKYLIFRTAVELLVLIYLSLLLVDPERYRPRLNLATWGLLAFVASAVLSGLVGSDWRASFFGTFERMEGVFTTLHYAALFVVLPCLFPRREWAALLRWSVAAGTALAAYGLAQHFGASWTVEVGRDRISATVGNPAYVAAYLLFQMGFSAYLAAADWSAKLRWVWLGCLVVQLATFTFTLTRGAMLGLVASLPVAAFTWLWLTRPLGHSRAVRRWVLAAALATIAVPLALVMFQKSDLVHGTPLLQRFADISFTAHTAQTRFYTWNSAWQGIREKPILGWGPEQFSVPFNKFINPLHYSGPNSETWFDHAHNIVLDILVSQGAIGLIGWLAFFIGLLAAAWKLAREPEHRKFGVAAVAILVAYFVQNMFLFDVLIVWMMLAVLGAVLFSREHAPDESSHVSSRTRWYLLGGLAAYVAVLAVVAAPINWQADHVSKAIIAAKGWDESSTDVANQLDFFEREVFSQPLGTGDSEASRQLASSVLYHAQAGHLSKDASLRTRALQLAVSTLLSAWQRHPNDLQTGLAYAKLRAVQGDATRDPQGYRDAAAAVQRVIELSPNRVEAFLDLSLYQVASGDTDAALATSRHALDLVPNVAYPKWALGIAYAKAGSMADAAKWFELALEDPEFSARVFSQGSQIQRLSDVYIALEDWAKLAAMYRHVVELYPDRAEAWGALSITYQKLNEFDLGIAAAKEAMRLEPEFVEPATALIKELEQAKRRAKR